MKIRVQKTPPSKLLCGPASTPDGDAVVALTEKGELCRMSLLQDRDLVDVIEAWQYEWPKTFFTVGAIPKNFLKLPILMIGTDVQKKIWSAIMRIPRGKVLSYGEVAAKAGLPRAARAVGTACRTNHLGLIVPCHRVISANGIGGYGSDGVAEKRALLAAEGVFLK